MPEPVITQSRETIDRLKASWQADPSWDLETTEGFEAYYDELKAYSDECHRQWEHKRLQRLRTKAIDLGHPGNLELAEAIERLEDKARRCQVEAGKSLLHYFGLLMPLSNDNRGEIEAIAENLIDAAVAQAKAEILPQINKPRL